MACNQTILKNERQKCCEQTNSNIFIKNISVEARCSLYYKLVNGRDDTSEQPLKQGLYTPYIDTELDEVDLGIYMDDGVFTF